MFASNPSRARKIPHTIAPILVNSAKVPVRYALRRQGRISRMEVGDGVSQGERKLHLFRITNPSAGEECRIEFPYDPSKVRKPRDLWKKL